MYYHDDIIVGVEELVMDFLQYRREKRGGRSVVSAHSLPSVPLLSSEQNDMLVSEMFAQNSLPFPFGIDMQNGLDTEQGEAPNQDEEGEFMPPDEMEPDEMEPDNDEDDNGGMPNGGNGGRPNGGNGNLPNGGNGGRQNGETGNQPNGGSGGRPNGGNNNQPNGGNGNLPNGGNNNQPNGGNGNQMTPEFIRQVMSELNKKLYPFVVSVLKEYEYDGSPIYDEYIDKESLAEIVDKVIDAAKKVIPEISDITAMAVDRLLTYKALRAAVEMLVLFYIIFYEKKRK